jgi:type IV secretory pathway TraG/TraD family ATPase VirD4
MQPLDLLRKYNAKGRIIRSNGLHLGTVVDLEDDDWRIREYFLPENIRTGHLGCFGTTRTGKTRLLTHMIEQDILTDKNVVFIDPKGDTEAISCVVHAATLAGRLDEILYISPINADYSLKIDPLSYYYLLDEIVDHVISGIKAKEEYFINVASEITTAVVAGLVAMSLAKGQKPNLNFMQVKERIDYNSLKSFSESLQYLKNHTDPKVQELANESIFNISQVLNSPQDFFAKVSSSLRTVLTLLTSSTTGKIIGKAENNEFIKRFEEGKRVILICNTGSMLARRTAHIIGKVIVSMIQSMAGRFFASGRKLDPPLALYLDEGHNVLYWGIEDFFSKAGGAGVYINLFTQSMAQIAEAVSEEGTASIMDNMNTWIFMRVNHNDTAKYVEDNSPLKIVYKNVISMGGSKVAISMKEDQERLILMEKVLKLKPRYFYLRSEGKVYKGIVPFIQPSPIKIHYPNLTDDTGKNSNAQEKN